MRSSSPLPAMQAGCSLPSVKWFVPAELGPPSLFELPPSLFELRRGMPAFEGETWLACLAEAGEASEGWRPGLDLNQDKEHCTAPASSLPPPGQGDHRRSRAGEPCLPRFNLNNPRARLRSIVDESVPRHKGHPPRIVTDVERGARACEAGDVELFDHLVFAVSLQSDAGAQLPVVRQAGAGEAVKRILEKAVGLGEFQQRQHVSRHADLR